MRGQELRLAFLEPAGGWDPHRRPCWPQEKGRRKMKMERRCSVMPAPGLTAPPQMSKLGLREAAEQSPRRVGWLVRGPRASEKQGEGRVGSEEGGRSWRL